MRRKLPVRTILAALALSVTAAACASDRVTAPAAPASGSLLGLVGGVVGGVVNTVNAILVPAVHRGNALSSDVAVSKTIGSAGGTISIPQAGMTITFAPGAVSAPTTITATANAGGYYAYSFQPHGIQFNAPVVITQDMRYAQTTGLLGGLLSVKGGYMADGISDLNQSTGTVSVSEQLPAATTYKTDSTGTVYPVTTYTVKHFSGYILTGG